MLAYPSVYHRRMGDPSTDVTAFLLAGGKSTRMGTDKAFLRWEGPNLLSRAIAVASAVTPNVAIVGSREKFAAFAPVIEDIFPDRGPLAGIHAALTGSTTALNLMLAIDMPFVTAEFLQYLISQALKAGDAVATVPRSDGRMQPLCAIYRRSFASHAEESLKAGRNKIDPLFCTIPIRTIEENEIQAAGFSSATFRNVNTPEDLNLARREPLPQL
jgi:molybdopterin-guanine dinucleotide biosynthesis protein A